MERSAGEGDGYSLRWPEGLLHKLLSALVLVVVAGGVFYGVQRYRYRFVRTNEDLLRFLPVADVSTFYGNVAALRAAGFLKLIEGPQAPDYRAFVRETGFDYGRDIDALAGAADERQIWCALRGRFDWRKLREYVKRYGGECRDSECNISTSTPGRRASFRAVQPDVMLLAVSPDKDAARAMRESSSKADFPTSAPVWVRPSHAVLANPAQLPLALRIFAISLQSSEFLLVSLRQAEQSDDAFTIEVDAAFGNQPTAKTARQQLELNTGLLKRELAREHGAADPGDLTGLLTSGVFRVEQQHLIGDWQVRKVLLQALR